MNEVKELDAAINAARGVVEVLKAEQKKTEANQEIQRRIKTGYSGHSDFSDNIDLPIYTIACGFVILFLAAFYSLVEAIGN